MSLSLREVPFVVCDVETTGMSPAASRVTEICLLKLIDGEIVDSFESLVNPRQYIPAEITRLTGITNAMVYSAPPMEEIAADVATFLHGAAFVAHNVAFDWGFVSAELLRSAIPAPALPRLCTVKLARRLFPGMRSYSLGNLTAALGIPHRARHRARGDTEATATLFTSLLQRARETGGIDDLDALVSLQLRRPAARRTKRVSTLASQVAQLPTTPGVYYFRDSANDVLYIGKAKNLRARVRSYFLTTLQETSKVRQLLKRTTAITFEELPSELHALLREAKLIEELQPEFNSALRRKKLFPFLRLSVDDPFPRIDVAVEIADDGAEYFGPFRTFGAARLALDVIDHTFRLRKCDDRLHPDAAFAPCFYYDIKRCAAPCSLAQSQEEYQQEVQTVRKFLAAGEDNIVERIEARMRDHAARMEFEDAAYLRDRASELRGVVTKPRIDDASVSGQNYIFALPFTGGADLYFIRSGTLGKVVRARSAGSVRARIHAEIASVYYQESLIELSQKSAREMRILAGWINQRRDDGYIVPVHSERPADRAAEEVCVVLAERGLIPPPDHDQIELRVGEARL